MKNLLSTLFILLVVSAQAQVTSTFGTDADGWTLVNVSDNITATLLHNGSGGNPGGYISAVLPTDSDPAFFWNAPAKFLGNLTYSSLGLTLTYSQQQLVAGNNSEFNGNYYEQYSPDIIITSGTTNIYYHTSPKPALTPAWTTYTVTLDETSSWRTGTWSTDPLATRDQIKAALINVTSIRIRGNYNLTANTVGLDQVTLGKRAVLIAPSVTSFSPTSGGPGTSITINGNNFDATASNNAVYFGAIAGTITNASTTQLTITVPVGVQHGNITVINKTTGLSKNSTTPFHPTFAGGGRIIPASFSPKIDIPLAIDIEGFTITDVDGDGWSDLAVASSTAFKVIEIYRNLGLGGDITTASFAPKVTVAIPGTSTNTTGLQFVDLDGDAKVDAITSNVLATFGSAYFITFRNISTPGTIAFEAAEYWGGLTDDSAPSLVADLDGDGKPELVGGEGSYSTGGYFWISQNISRSGNIEFGTSIGYFTSGTAGFAEAHLGDLDNDGKPEMLVGHGNTFSVFKNNSVPGSLSLTNLGEITTDNHALQIVDFNLDGKNDIVFRYYGGSQDIRIRVNTNSGAALALTDFTTEVAIDGDLSIYGGLSVADINGDGKLDIIATDNADAGVFENVYAGGVFDANAFIPAYEHQGNGNSTYPTSPIMADLNGDQKPEIIYGATNTSPKRISIYQNINVHAPVISLNTVSPLKGAVGSTVTITGNNFSLIPSENKVWFGGVEATVLTATANLITAEVPAGATYAPVSVTKNGLTSRYRLPFQTTFGLGVTFDNTHFAPPVNFTLTGANYDLDIGDLNRDGKPDIIAEGTATNTYAFRNLHTTGAISSTSLIADDTTANFLNPRMEDFDGDGFFDIMSVNGPLRKNNSTLTEISFLPQVIVPLGASIVDFADFNNDGKTDMTLTTDLSGAGDLIVLENRTLNVPGNFVSGAFGFFSQNFVYNKPSADGATITGDFDGDGFADIVTTNPTADNVSIYRNLGVLKISTAQFATRVDMAVGDNPNRIYKGDFDSDGKLDLLVYHWTGTSTTLLIVLQNTSTVGNISFSRIDLTNPNAVTVAHIADLDGDGKPEILTTAEANNQFSIFKNLHTSGALTAASFGVPFNTTVTAPRAITTADINLDGKPEIIITRAAGLLVVYENLISGIPLPTITSFTPTSGAAATTVTITGTNFDISPANNIVTFNGTTAVVTASTTTSITTTVPVGTTTGQITVTVAGSTATSTQFFCVPSSPPSPIGLMAYYPFTGDANDLSGNNNNGTVNGATLTTDRFGVANSAYFFNGTNSYISVPNSTSLQSPTNKLTMNAWINMAGFSLVGQPFGPIFTKSNSTSTNFMYALAIGPAGGVEAEINNFSNFASAPYTFCFNQWYMVTAVLDNTTAYFYVNGSLIGTQTFTTNIAIDALGLQIGRDSPGLLETFNGKIDDIRIYNRALSDCEVAGLYTPASPPPVITSFSPSSGPVTAPVTISGTGFDPIPANNIVMFNGTTAVVTASTATSITTTVPAGATTGKISVTVSCLTTLSATDFTVTATPVITINSQPASTAVCDGAIANFTLTASGTTNLTYQWQKFVGSVFTNLSNSGGYSGTTTSTLITNTTGSIGAGDYRCVVSGDFAISVFSQTASLTFTTSTTLAEITVNGTTLTASPGDSYQWYQNGDAVANATSQSFEYDVFEYGIYQVDVTENGCTSTSAEFEYLITNIETSTDGFKLYPNPVEKILFTEYNPPYIITIINTSGMIIGKLNSSTREASIDLNSLASGVYFLRLKNEKGVGHYRITKK